MTLDDKFWNFVLIDGIDGTARFLENLIESRGIAVIRNTSDDSEYAKIDLGEPLEYINYVSFSYDSRYVAIGGCRRRGGLMFIYDLVSKESVVNVNTPKAVWNVAFTNNNAFAAYTSSPNTYFAMADKDNCDTNFISNPIYGKSFLTFSPDGSYFALSEQGYVSKYGFNGKIRDNWGHQPSSLVEIRSVTDHQNVIETYTDLSDSGISETSTQASVASVSFSNKNKHIMMVGKDGVVIIRNLKLII